MSKIIYSTICPNCKQSQELYQKVDRLMKSQKKSKFLFECDSCGFTSAIIIDGIDVFYKRSEITKT